MTNVAEQWVTVAIGLSEARVNELALVLVAREVPFQRRVGPSGFELWVPLLSAPVAAAELTLYRHENARAVGARPIEEVGEGWPVVIGYSAILCFVFIALYADPFDHDWLGVGRLEAGPMLAGEWWRAVTALTLHVELAHLGGNLAFGGFFGYFMGRYLGSGVGSLTVLVAAAGANVFNAWIQGPAHRSIGASTAVFAALGLLAVYSWRRGFLRDTPWRARVAPLVAALGLLAFTGTAGENTDLGAHLFGFIAGCASGAFIARFASVAWLRERAAQRAAGSLAIVAVIAAWAAGLEFGR
jgi:rhomboid protease GluP